MEERLRREAEVLSAKADAVGAARRDVVEVVQRQEASRGD
jgi:hypothetical protein